MKFCKDCVHHRPESSYYGGSLLPGVYMHFPARCYGLPTPKVNLVTGESISYAGDCADVRADGSKCGTSAVWFKAKP